MALSAAGISFIQIKDVGWNVLFKKKKKKPIKPQNKLTKQPKNQPTTKTMANGRELGRK